VLLHVSRLVRRLGTREIEVRGVLRRWALLTATTKFRNVQAGSRVAFVVDVVDTSEGWRPIYLEIRGTAEAITETAPPAGGFSREIIRIHPEWVRSFGLPPAGG
jgi:hypothetical protein